MKTTILTFASLALLAGAAFASGEHCVTRTLQTNYNDGLNGAVSRVCFSSESNFKNPKHDKCQHETK